MQYAYGAKNAVFMHMKDTSASLRALCKAGGIDVENLTKPLTPMTVGAAEDLMAVFAPEGTVQPTICGADRCTA